MASRPLISPWEGATATSGTGERRGRGARPDTAAAAQRGGGGGFGGAVVDSASLPRVVMQFPADTAQMLLSGTLAGGRVLSNKAQVVDAPVGDGHVVLFAIRPMWRWQTQGTFMLVFNTIMNWNDLRARGTPTAAKATSTDGSQ